MATTRPFAYNTGSTITNTTQVGSIAIANGGDRYDLNYGGLKWWNGPDEDLGYVIVHPTSGGTQPNPDNTSAYLGFWRSKLKTDSSFISLVNAVFKQNFNNTTSCTSYLSTNNYWTSFVSSSIVTSGLIMNWDIQNTSSYSGVGTTIFDLSGHSNGSLVGTIDYTAGSPNYLLIQGGVSEYITSSTDLNSYLSPPTTGTDISVFMWVYPTSNGVIVSEQGVTTPDGGWYDSQIELVSGTTQFRVWGPSGAPYIYSSAATPFNNWYYVGFTYSASTLIGYVNGQSVGSTAVSRQSPGQYGSGLYYNLGYPTATNMGSGAGSTFRFGGMQVYNIGLTSNQVLNNFNSDKSKYGL